MIRIGSAIISESICVLYKNQRFFSLKWKMYLLLNTVFLFSKEGTQISLIIMID